MTISSDIQRGKDKDSSVHPTRVHAYIDGFNLYYGLKQRNWRQYYWIDPYALIGELVGTSEKLESVKYFTARVNGPEEKRHRQGRFLDAIHASSACEVIYGKYNTKRKKCRSCQSRYFKNEEKMTDTAIAVNFVADAFLGRFDKAILVGGDTDIVPAVEAVRQHFPEKIVQVWFPPARLNDEVGAVCNQSNTINGEHLKAARMPPSIATQHGTIIDRPESWK